MRESQLVPRPYALKVKPGMVVKESNMGGNARAPSPAGTARTSGTVGSTMGEMPTFYDQTTRKAIRPNSPRLLEAMRAEGVTKKQLLIMPKKSFRRDGKKHLSPAITDERHKAHLDTQGEFVRVVLDKRAEYVLKERQKAEAQQELRSKLMKQKRAEIRAAKIAKAQEEGWSEGQIEELEAGLGASAAGEGSDIEESISIELSELESIRDVEDRRERQQEVGQPNLNFNEHSSCREL